MSYKPKNRFYSKSNNSSGPQDDIGNRKSREEARYIADDIGNRYHFSVRHDFVQDDIGNHIQNYPTHLKSGILQDFEGRSKNKRDEYHPKSGEYWVGGVNPKVSGMPAKVQTEVEEPKEAKEPKKSDGFFKRWLESGEDENPQGEYQLKSTPEEKRQAALLAVTTIFQKTGLEAQVDAMVLNLQGKSSVFVFVEEKAQKSLLNQESGLWALNLLVNKIVNRYPDDRIRLAVLPKSQQELCLSYAGLLQEG